LAGNINAKPPGFAGTFLLRVTERERPPAVAYTPHSPTGIIRKRNAKGKCVATIRRARVERFRVALIINGGRPSRRADILAPYRETDYKSQCLPDFSTHPRAPL
jgi:hypothetical protein